MVFSSLFFIFVFLPVTIILYYLSPTIGTKNFVLIIASLIFYAWGEPVCVLLLILSASVDYINGRIIERHRYEWQATVALTASLVINLGLLAVFKYSGLILNSFYGIFHINRHFTGFALPVGISFYTFQTLSYVIDVYRGECDAQENYGNYLLYVSLFPQLVAGPIVRYVDVAAEIEYREFKISSISYGINRFITGLAKKVIIANTAGSVAKGLLEAGGNGASVAGSWLGILLFAFQIYFDFSGYSDMAIGLGKMLGFTYKENFNYPYISTSATEFWRRWHMSLGSFFRDYLYIPLGGNRYKMFRNLFIVWFLTGLWHGASWNFVIWGLYYGLLIGLEKIFDRKSGIILPGFIGMIYCSVITLIGWVFFYFTNIGEGLAYLKQMLGLAGLPLTSPETSIIFKNNAIFIMVAALASTPVVTYICKKLKLDNTPLLIIKNGVLFFVSITMLLGQSYNPFLYFRF